MARTHLARRLTRPAVLLTALVAAVAAGWVLAPVWFGRTETYVPGAPVEGLTRALDRGVEPGAAIHFSERTAASGVEFVHFAGGRRSTQLPEDMGSGAAWSDIDGDGDPDLLLVDFAGPLGAEVRLSGGNRLFRNLGDGRFEDATAASGLDWKGRGLGAVFFDADGDRDDDLLVTTFGTNVFFRNRGGGQFEEQTQAAGLGAMPGFWTGAAAADFDGDGWLDVYVCGYVDYRFRDGDRKLSAQQYGEVSPFTLNPSSYPPIRNLLYRNRGAGRFEEVAEERGVANPEGRSLAAIWSDFDDDGWPDLYVANDVSDNVCYRNTGDGFFEDVSHVAGVADYRGAMGLATGDVDGDLDLDLFVTHWIAQENALYVNLRDGTAALRFEDAADRWGVGQSTLDFIGWGTVLLDLDADADLDLVMTNGSTFQERDDASRLVPMPDQWFENRGPGKGFVPMARAPLPAEVGRGLAAADWDADGRVDLALTRNGGTARLLHNDAASGNTLTLRLVDRGTNSRAIGAKIVVVTGQRTQVLEVQAGGSYLSQHFADRVVGLGAARQADSIRVRWPDRQEETLGPIAAGRWRVVRAKGVEPL